MATEANSDGQEPFKMKGFSVSRIMQTALEVLKTFEDKGRWVQATFDFALDGKEPSFFEEGEPAETSFNMVRPWLEEQRKRKQDLSEQGRRGGQAPKDPASYYGNKNAQKHPRQDASPYFYANPDEERKRWKEEEKEEAARKDKVEADKPWEERAANFKKDFTLWVKVNPEKLALSGQDFKAIPALRFTLWQKEILRSAGLWSETPAGQAAIKNATAASPIQLRPFVEKIVEETDCEACDLEPPPKVAPLEDAAASTRFQFAENLGLPAVRLAFTGAEFETLEAKLKNPALIKEALFRARAGKFSKLEAWETIKREKQVLKLAPLLKILFAEIEEDLAKERAKDATPKETEGGNASTQGPARPPQNSIQANRESARNLPSENRAQEVAPAEEPKNKKPKLWAALFKQKCARALDVPESAVELKQAEFEEIKAGLEGAGALRNLLRTARQEAQTKQGQKMRKDLLKGGKLPLKLYASTLWNYEKAYFNANATERKALRAKRVAQPFLYKAPPKMQKGKAK